jgi:hypothetical protein
MCEAADFWCTFYFPEQTWWTLLTQGGLWPAEGPGGPALRRHPSIFGCQQLLWDSWPAHTSMHASRFPRCISCMHGESRIEYSVNHIFHIFPVDFYIRHFLPPLFHAGRGKSESLFLWERIVGGECTNVADFWKMFSSSRKRRVLISPRVCMVGCMGRISHTN